MTTMPMPVYIGIIVIIITICIALAVSIIGLFKDIREVELEQLNIKKRQNKIAADIASAHRDLEEIRRERGEVEILDCSDIDN